VRAQILFIYRELAPIKLLTPFEQVKNHIRSHQSTNIELLSGDSTAIMNCDYCFIRYDRTAALTRFCGNCIPYLVLLRINDLNSFISGLSELRKFDLLSIHIKGFVILTILRISKDFEVFLFVFN
jgi:hypothetical protein